MKDLPKEFKYFFVLITSVAAVGLGYVIFNTSWTQNDAKNLIIFAILAIASESLPVALPKGGYVTVSYSVFMSAVILFPPGVSLTVVALGGLLVVGKASVGEPLFKRVFNAAQFVLSVSLAYGVFAFSGVSAIQLDAQSVFIYILVCTVFAIANMAIVSFALGFMQRKSPWSIWVNNLLWSLPSFLALAPLGFLMALIYESFGALGLGLLTIPLLSARHSFQLYIDMKDNYLSTVEALVQAIEAKDPYTSGHSGRVASLAALLAEKAKLHENKIEFVKYAGVLHDVGKIGVSEAILNKEGKLADYEWEVIRNHPVIGQNIIKNIKFLFDVGLVVRHHHERYDGTGYPDGLKGEDIPLESRIISVADCYDAITSDRSYRKGRTPAEALVELKRVAGTQLDPHLVALFCEAMSSDVDSPTSVSSKGNAMICEA